MSNITITRQQFRQLCRLARAERARKARKVAKAQRKAFWASIYWAQALRFETFKIGGLRFIKLGRISISLCVTAPREA
jgi:hypothetical protein